MTKNKRKKCFVITPIGNENDQIRRHIEGIIDAAIKPALEEKYEIVVSHKINDIGSITKRVVTEIYNDELVIANLTGLNANVMYELAFRHSIGKPVIIIAEKGTNLPFDVRSERTIFYQNDAQGVLDLKEELEKKESCIDFDAVISPIHDFLKELLQEENIVKIANSENVENANLFKFILEKLDSIQTEVSQLSISQAGLTPHSIVVEYAERPKEATDEEIYKLIKLVVSQYGELSRVLFRNERIFVYFKTNNVFDYNIGSDICRSLEEMGLTELHYKLR